MTNGKKKGHGKRGKSRDSVTLKRKKSSVDTDGRSGKMITMEENHNFLQNAARLIRFAKDFKDLENIVKSLKHQLPELDQPPQRLTVDDVFLDEDEHATPLVPEDQHRTAVEIWPDGNCLPACLSLYQYGCQTFTAEMRVRLVCELVDNYEQYLSPQFMKRGFGNGGPFYIENLTMYCESGEYPEDRLKQHLFDSRYDGQYCGVFHVAAAASVLRRVVHSVYPQYGGHTVRDDINRKFLPREEAKYSDIYIMWSNTTGIQDPPNMWRPNHFVALLER